MARKIVIDLSKYRSAADNNQSPVEALFLPPGNQDGLRTIRELAVFRYTCRKCKDAPCIEACPVKALEKDRDGIITRAINLCISCKSCVVICPFGTLMTDFFRFKKDRSSLFDLTDDAQAEQFILESPEGTVRWVDPDEKLDGQTFQLNDRVLVKELTWDND